MCFGKRRRETDRGCEVNVELVGSTYHREVKPVAPVVFVPRLIPSALTVPAPALRRLRGIL